MGWISALKLRLGKVEPFALWGTLFLAGAMAVAISTQSKDWRPPFVAFIGFIGLVAVVGPRIQSWKERLSDEDNDRRFSWTITISIVAALLVLLAYRAAPANLTRNTTVTLLLLAAAATVIGVLIGFLFGIPRVATKAEGGTSATGLETNTNLELISDWLTKIIVGVGLVQADDLVRRFNSLLENLHATYGLPVPLTGGLLLFFLVAGFLNGYLWTRLILTRYFSVSERALRTTPEYYEGLMNAYLYQPKPNGFQEVFKLFDRYTSRFGEPQHARIWVYVACAYGQQYSWMRRGDAVALEAPEVQPIVAKTVEAIRNAIAIDPDAIELLRSTSREGFDNDLAQMAREQPSVKIALGS